VAGAVKFTIPTGRSEYYSGFDSWMLEPLLGTQWLFDVPEWFLSFQARYIFAFASLPGKEARTDYARLESFIGYENKKFYAFIQPDYRYEPSRDSHTFFINFEGSYKFTDKGGIRAQYKPRLVGESFFQLQILLGVYFYLK
jgi:hypothetical protein